METENPPIDENSIENQMPIENEDIEEEVDQNDIGYKVSIFEKKTLKLHEDEEILKETLKMREQEVFSVYEELSLRKNHLLKLVQNQHNKKKIHLDIGLQEEFQEMKKLIDNQQNHIQQMKNQIAKQGLTGGNNDEEFIKIKHKTEIIEKEYQVGRKFSSTQYVRDYLQRPQAYKVAYEDAKYEYEMRLRLKQSLEQEKVLFERRKEEIKNAKKKERQEQQELQKEKDMLLMN